VYYEGPRTLRCLLRTEGANLFIAHSVATEWQTMGKAKNGRESRRGDLVYVITKSVFEAHVKKNVFKSNDKSTFRAPTSTDDQRLAEI
jgi:hypothetical protein